jgi:hypothetical protein
MMYFAGATTASQLRELVQHAQAVSQKAPSMSGTTVQPSITLARLQGAGR